ncbi:hypothetical protein GCM10009677_57520 [Sphaerisporangium rubeum]|uniref:Uncharacterized protein n=1 Tax=Sphaerisporangium rubeum TaxID=321317 RepID=A0A7X0M7I6_9ACTN|nr:hypothetical protein [Sphaerisporangium rubeum]MBB6474332.1 hypothetical protein [Sphaerisporangium rubeum]
MSHVITIDIDPGHPGIWPGGEPTSVRDAYDAQQADQKQQATGKAAKR